jgi:hypothetical protein
MRGKGTTDEDFEATKSREMQPAIALPNDDRREDRQPEAVLGRSDEQDEGLRRAVQTIRAGLLLRRPYGETSRSNRIRLALLT